MSQESKEERIDLGTLSQVLVRMAVRSTAISIIGATGMIAVELLNLDRLLIMLIGSLCGWYIFYAAYQVTEQSSKRQFYLAMKWNHLLMVTACLIGGIWGGVVYAGVCVIPTWTNITWLHFSMTECSDMLLIGKRFLSASVICSIFLLFVPSVRAYFYWGR